MRIRELLEAAKSNPPKPRNFVAKNAVKTTSGAGAHRDKKKEQKQGYEKHKSKEVAEEDVQESATAGATSAGNVAVGAVYKNKKAKTAKNSDGTTKNALDLKGTNLITGGSLVKR